MREKIKKQPIIAVLLPVTLLLGVVIIVATSIGPLLNAALENPLVQVENEEGNPVDNFKSKKEFEILKLISKEDGIFELKYDEKFSVSVLDNKKDESSVPIFNRESLPSKEIAEVFKQNEDETTSSGDGEENKSEKKVTCIQVEETESKGSFYFKLDKTEEQWVKIERKTSITVNVDLSDTKKKDRVQKILSFENLEQASSESSSLQESSETESSKNKVSETKQTEDHQQEKSSEKVAKEDTSSSKENREEKTEQSSERETKGVKEIQSKSVDVNDKEDVNKGEKIVSVPTESTKKTLKELEAEEYEEADSLRTPKLLSEENEKVTKAASDETIVIREAKVAVKTGTKSFDTDNDPGHDLDDSNDIVRSFDQVVYLVSFSIQNKSTKTKYSNIRYRVVSKLPDALKLVNNSLVNIGEIANGENYDLTNGEQYSEGIMESVISDTGQVFVPVTVSVFGAQHGTVILPEIKLEIVDAKNEETGKTDSINKTYDSSKLSGLKVPNTTVSASPSVSVQLVQGEIKNNIALGSTNTDEYAYDVGVITTLKPLDGRDVGDYRGSTFPSGKITYNVKQKGTYAIGTSKGNMTSDNFNPFYVESYAPAVKDRSIGDWKTTVGGKTTDLDQFARPLAVPNAKTYRIYNSQPVIKDKTEIGVFDSGDFSVTREATVSNEKYSSIYNPYTYLMTGERSPTASAKSFSSLELIFSWNRKKTLDIAQKNNWTRYDMTLYIDSISYDGITSPNSSSISYPTVVGTGGSYTSAPTILTEQLGGLYYIRDENQEVTDIRVDNASPGTTGAAENFGNAQISTGSRVWFSNRGVLKGDSNFARTGGSEQLFMWDPSAFKYDKTKSPVYYTYSTLNNSAEYEYGVAKNIVNTPAYTLKARKMDLDKSLYDWYDSPEEAEAHGAISAVLYKGKFEHNPAISTTLEKMVFVPVIVTANSGATTPAGNPVVLIGTQRFIDKDGNVMYESAINGTAGKTGNGNTTGTGTYKPTVFSNSGVPLSYPMEYWNQIGESAYVKNMSITTKTEVEKSLYPSNEDVGIKVTGVVNGSKTSSYDSSLITTLPKGLTYKAGSSVDGTGNALPEPTVQKNGDGTSTLTWNISKVSVEDGVEVNFVGVLNQEDLSYENTGYTNNLTVKTVGELWATNNPESKDSSKEEIRSSSDYFMVQRMQQVILSKSNDKNIIEVGNNDPVGEDTSITYEVSLVNETLDDIVDGRLLDVLPYNEDSRGTVFSGDYTITDVKVTGPNVSLSYSNDSVDEEKTDPIKISGWPGYTPGTSSISSIKNAKAILVSIPRLKINEKVKLTITIQPKNQKAGDVLVNDAQMNSEIELPVNSQAVWTYVYGRDLTGYVWYDDDYDGLIGTKSDGSPEDSVGNIPVKLYRTSQKDSSHKKELVKENLSGQKFIDASGNSLVMTDSNGMYKFEDLPEGEYIAEFMVGDLIKQKAVIVTKQLVGSDPTKNSKADPDNYKTPEYNQPELKDLPTAELTDDNKVHHITDVNAGLSRLSKIRVFKYEEGTVVDSNGDGKLSEAEIESSGKPLKDAEFDLYEGDSTNSADKIGSAKTDENGWLEYIGLPPGDYTLVETKAPEGFELLKDPIKVTIPTYNFIAKVHVADSSPTKLPFAGGTKAMRIILIVSACLLVIGMTGVILHFRPIKVRGGK